MQIFDLEVGTQHLPQWCAPNIHELATGNLLMSTTTCAANLMKLSEENCKLCHSGPMEQCHTIGTELLLWTFL
eukprot:4672596-Amphidinium_carterae.1